MLLKSCSHDMSICHDSISSHKSSLISHSFGTIMIYMISHDSHFIHRNHCGCAQTRFAPQQCLKTQRSNSGLRVVRWNKFPREIHGFLRTLWNTYTKLLKIDINIVGLLIKHGDLPYVCVKLPEGKSFKDDMFQANSSRVYHIDHVHVHSWVLLHVT